MNITDLIGLRHRQPAAFQRWVEGAGRDVVVVASLNESTYWSYDIGFPSSGNWLEVFNSDVYAIARRYCGHRTGSLRT